MSTKTHSKKSHSSGWIKARMCLTKKTFPDHKAAVRAVQYLSNRTDKHWKAYKCPHCHKYHLSSKEAE